MSLVECFKVALGGLSAHKMRSGLTMLGIIIGVGAVIALLSVGQGVQKTIEEQLMGAGANLVFILPGGLGHPGTTMESTLSLTAEDAQAIAEPRNVPDLLAVAPEMSGFETISYGDEDFSASVAGLTPEMAGVRNLEIEYGEFIGFRNLQAHSRVVVLGSRLAEELFPQGITPVGQRVKIRSIPFQVIGVTKEKGGTAFGSMDDMAFIPLTTAQRLLYPYQRNSSGDYLLSVVYTQVSSQERIDQAIEDITALLRRRHEISLGSDDDFSVISQADLVSVLGQITGILTIFLGSIAGISLLVGGIGIMNIMLVSVTERTREVGIRMAVGARRRDILLQFLVEAVALSLVGGMVGILLGGAGSFAISKVSQELTTYVSPQAILLATGFSITVGLFFGIYPAARASRLDPIQALRYE